MGASWDAEVGAATLVVVALLPPDEPHPLTITAIAAVPPKTEMNPPAPSRAFIACSFRGKPDRCTCLYSGPDERTMNAVARAAAAGSLDAAGLRLPMMLGLPDGVNTCLFDLDGVLTQT